MRQGRYRKNQLSPDECKTFAENFHPFVEALMTKFQQNEVNSCEFVAAYVVEGLKLVKGSQWKGARLREGVAETPLETLQIYSFRGIPLSVNRTFKAWRSEHSALELFFQVPTTEVVLNLQSRGVRCVTCVTSRDELSSYVLNERDPLSFTLHDLIHADHFLRDPEQKLVQVGFSRWMLEIWKDRDVQSEMLARPEFSSLFEYACADMNSHGAHLVKYLKAIFCQQNLEDELIRMAQTFSPRFQEALFCLNSENEMSEHLQVLQSELFLRGSDQ